MWKEYTGLSLKIGKASENFQCQQVSNLTSDVRSYPYISKNKALIMIHYPSPTEIRVWKHP